MTSPVRTGAPGAGVGSLAAAPSPAPDGGRPTGRVAGARAWLVDLLGGLLSVRALVALLAGRAAVRITFSMAPLVLRPSWTDAEFAAYAAAMARFVFLVPVLGGVVEKSALKLVPRSRRAGPQLVSVYLGLLALVCAAAAGWVAVAGATSRGPRLVVLAGVVALALGVNQALVALHRAAGRVWVDLAVQGTVFAALAGGLVAVVGFDAAPETLLAGWAAVVAVVDVVVLAGLLVASPPRRRLARRLVRFVGADAGLQGSTDLVVGVSVAAVYGAVAVTGHEGELADLFVVLSLATMLTTGYTYLMRVLQPSISVRQHTRRAGPALAAPLWRRRNLVPAAGYLVVVVVAGRLAVTSGWPPGGTWWLVAVFLATVPVLSAAAGLNFLFENGDGASLRRTVRGAVAGALGVAVLAVPLTAAAGAVGAVGALAAGDLIHVAVLMGSPSRTTVRGGEAGAPVRRAPSARPRPAGATAEAGW